MEDYVDFMDDDEANVPSSTPSPLSEDTTDEDVQDTSPILRFNRKILVLSHWRPERLIKSRAIADMHIDKELFQVKYKIIKQLRGTLNKAVYEGRKRTDGTPVVIKKILEHKHCRAVIYPHGILFEAAVMEALNWPTSILAPGTVPQLLATYSWFGVNYILMQPLPASVNLMEFVNAARRSQEGRGRLSENMARYIFTGLHRILHQMMRMEMVYHSNVILTNVVISLADLKLQVIDFDYADYYQANINYRNDKAVKRQYLPPEAHEENKMTFQADSQTVYSLGVLLYTLYSKNSMMPCSSVAKIKAGDWRMPEGLSPPCQEVIKACLAPLDTRVTIDNLQLMAWCVMPIDHEKLKREAAEIRKFASNIVAEEEDEDDV